MTINDPASEHELFACVVCQAGSNQSKTICRFSVDFIVDAIEAYLMIKCETLQNHQFEGRKRSFVICLDL